MKNLSKSRYTLFRQCSKALWLTIYKPNEAKDDPALQARFAEGNVIGDLAMGYLGPYEEVTAHKPDGGLDLTEMIRRTQDAMARGVENITEASFSWDGNYCAVDILHKTPGICPSHRSSKSMVARAAAVSLSARASSRHFFRMTPSWTTTLSATSVRTAATP